MNTGGERSAAPRYFGAVTTGSMVFRPSVLAKEQGICDAMNAGAAGALVIRNPGLRAGFLAELRRK